MGTQTPGIVAMGVPRVKEGVTPDSYPMLRLFTHNAQEEALDV